MFDDQQLTLASDVLARCRARGFRLVTAESCTGGLISGCLTAIPGSSDVFDRGYVTYSNAAKTAALAVPADLLRRLGAVSEPVAVAMADGALAESGADLSVAVTGISGPGGGSAERPVGLVHFAAAIRDADPPLAEHHVFAGDRHQVRMATVTAALRLLLRRLD